MFSLRSITVFAALAFATISSAAPALPGVPSQVGDVTNLASGIDPSTVNSNVPGGVNSLTGVTGTLGTANGLTKVVTNGVAVAPTRREEQLPFKSAGEYFTDANESIKPIVAKLKIVVASGDEKKVDKKAVLGCLNEIVAVLHICHDGLKGWQHVDNLHALLTFKGVVLTVHELALIVYGLLLTVIEILYLVIKVVGFVDVTLWAVVVVIGGILCEILAIVFGLVVGLNVAVSVVIGPLVEHCTYLRFTQILVLIGIKA